MEIGCLLNAVHGFLLGRRQPLDRHYSQRRQHHGEDHHSRHRGRRFRVHDADGQRRAVEHEGEFAALREQRGAMQRLAVPGAEQARDHVDSERLHDHERNHAAGDQRPVGDDKVDVQRHADTKKEQPEQNAPERLDIRFKLVTEGRFRQQHAGEERAHRHGKPAPLHEQCGAQHHHQRRGSHDFARAGPGQESKQRVHQELARDKHKRDSAHRQRHRLPQRSGVRVHFSPRGDRRENCNQRQQGNDRQIFQQQDGDRPLPGRRRYLSAIFHHLHDYGRRRQHKAERADHRRRPWQPKRYSRARQQRAAGQHLNQPQPEDVASHRP